jgi:DNA-binding transcriptional LysR family regulator
MEEELERVAAGRGIVVLPQSAASYYQQPGVFHVRIGDIPPAETCLAWPSSRRSPLIAEFANLAAAPRPAAGECGTATGTG